MLDRLKRLLAPPHTAPMPDPASATEADIRACFRLLLGRAPNPEELRGHLSQAGSPLPGVVAGYVNSLEFARRGLLRPETAAPTLSTTHGFSIYAQESDAMVGRHVLAGAYEPEVAAVFRRVLRPGMGVADVGANIGYFTMLSAQAVGPTGFVLAVEPNPANARMIEASRRANGFDHVEVAQVAAGRGTGLLTLNATHSNGTTSAPSDALEGLLGAQTVACVTLDALVGARPIGLLKVDVEGAEYNALMGAEGVLRRDRPPIITEFSPDLMPGISGIDGPGYLRFLFGLGYEVALIEPDGALTAMGQDAGAVMAAYAARGVDHVDLFATAADL